MNVEVTRIRDANDLARERLVIRAKADIDIGQYVVFKAKAKNGEVYGGLISAAYWFPDKKVKTGDLVILYTKSGTQSEKQNSSSGTTSHFFYWGLDRPAWKSEAAVVVEIRNWNKFFPEEETVDSEQ